MQLQRALVELPDVLDAGVVMATPANKDLLAASDLGVISSAGPDDLLIVVKAVNEVVAESALSQLDELIAKRRSSVTHQFRPRSLESAVEQLPSAQWVLVSVPGRYAADVAKSALRLNLNVFLFSDNVSLSDELELKNEARDKGLLVMGPDCGTAIIDGIGLGFANRVNKGQIGIVGASGTGLQAITSEIANRGYGITQAIGTGGRDLSGDIGALTTLSGLKMLAQDNETKVIVIVSKPPEPEVAIKILQAARRTGKPVVVNFIGYSPPARQLGNLHFAINLTDAGRLAVEIQKTSDSDSSDSTGKSQIAGGSRGYIRGLFSGGTLAYEAVMALRTFLSPLYSNVSADGVEPMLDLFTSRGHAIIDLGEDEFTQGRLHPMMDNEFRIRRLFQEAQDPDITTILFDVVLGEGAHIDPVSELAPAIVEARQLARGNNRELDVIAIVVGTEDDPQGIENQIQGLRAVGVTVYTDTIEAANDVGQKLTSNHANKSDPNLDEMFSAAFSGINVGLEIFYDSLVEQGAEVIHVDWRPPAGGNESLMSLLAKMK
jgi:FdrA protein